MQRARLVRNLGWVLVVLGTVLAGGMGVITYKFSEMVYHSADPDATSHWNGGQDMLLAAYAIFGLVIVFGVVSFANGVWQILYGRRNWKLSYLVLGLAIVFWLIAKLVRLGTS